MKRILIITGAVLAMLSAASCQDEPFDYKVNTTDINDVAAIALKANHQTLLADGNCVIELYPELYNRSGQQIPDNRVKDEWLSYTDSEGGTLTRYYSTSDASKIGKNVRVKLSLKGTSLVSNEVSFRIEDPKKSEYSKAVKVPVVFHIIQTTEDVEDYGGPYRQEKIEQMVKKINYMFASNTTQNAAGVNSNISIVLAETDPDGRRLSEPGINRITVRDIDITDGYENFIQDQRLIWPYEKYLNIWLISDRESKISDFGAITDKCVPRYAYPGFGVAPQGSDIQAYSSQKLKAADIGIIYKLQEMNNTDRTFFGTGAVGYNTLGYYIGGFFGLLPTFSAMRKMGNDYCDDTIDYFNDSNAPRSNEGVYKYVSDYRFFSENIMDDATGGHKCISRDQSIRMRWFMENAVGRKF